MTRGKSQTRWLTAWGPVLLLSLAYCADTASAYTAMSVVGDWQNWNPYPANMSNVGASAWQGDLYLYPTGWTRFKFVADETWSSTQWGDTDQSDFLLPVSATAEVVTGAGNDILVSNLTSYGIYRFTFNDSTRAYTIEFLQEAPASNLLRNPGFERQGTSSAEAWYWQWGAPDPHGGKWGHTDRRNWRAHSGSWEATIEAQWSGSDPDYGGWWQEVPAVSGQMFEASGWFWADDSPPYGPWTAAVAELKIEFYDTGLTQLLTVATNLLDVGSTWIYKSVQATAPDDTAWARIVVFADHMGSKGALQIDDLALRVVAYRQQYFTTWGAFTNDGCHELDDWVLCTGKVTRTNALSDYAASLPPPGTATNYIQSPLFAEGIGYIHFWYRHGLEPPELEATNPVAFRVLKSSDGTNWTEIGSVTNIRNLGYLPCGIWQQETTPYMIRIEHFAGTDRLLIDDITVNEPSDIRRVMDFDDWPDEGTNYGYHAWDGWEVNTGRVSTINADSGKSLELPPPPTGSCNFLLSPQFDDGYGEIRFRYARGTNRETATRLALEASADGTNWDTIALVTNITSTSYAQFQQYFYSPSGSRIRICNLAETSASATVRIEEHFDGAPDPPPGWEYSGIDDYYTSDQYSGEDAPALKFDDTGDSVLTASFSSPTNLDFWLRGAGTDTASTFRVECYDGSTWSTTMLIVPLPTSGTTYSTPLATNVVRVRFYYVKSVGNAALDDVLIAGTPIPPAPQGVFLDQIEIDPPALHRTQDFDSWPAMPSYGDDTYQGWNIHDAFVDTPDAYRGQACRIKNDGAWISSPPLLGGLGTITFQYRRLSTSGIDPTYALQVSSNAADWVTFTNLSITSTNYRQISLYRYDTTNLYFRILRTAGDADSSIAVFDEISVAEPLPAADVVINAWHDPDSPGTNDEVTLLASAVTRYGATITNMTAYYRIGTSGAFSAMAMAPSGTVNWAATSAVPPQSSGTVVQYFIRSDYDGPGSELTAPRYYPSGGSNDPAWYAVPRSQPGQVWINELNYVNDWWDPDTDTNEFVELAGPAGFDLSGWQIEFMIATGEMYYVYASYTLTNGSALGNATNGYGFFVIGDTDVPNVDMVFTHSNNAEYGHISDGDGPSGVRLLNEAGGVEQSLSYGGPIEGFDPIPAAAFDDGDVHIDPWDVQLSGSGTGYQDFAWALTNNMTPGEANAGQTLEPSSSPPPPQVVIVSFALGTNVTIRSTGTNTWTPQPWYATNLASPDWIAVSPYWSAYDSGTDTVWFDYPVTSGPCFFRIQSTNTP
ncbi:MAG TPA: hypothetical protein EYP62_01150 [Kiritimatiellae bacterium]|nr:hypothetical protein [Kiritimatiellia bacterium]